MITETVHVPNISSEQGTPTIEDRLMTLVGVQKVTSDLPSKRITFSYKPPATLPIIKAKMEEIGYPAGEDLGIYPAVRRSQTA
ncbi:MAG: heavy-metal-associated domain-containing protein [Ardenticatenaceae bacterium]